MVVMAAPSFGLPRTITEDLGPLLSMSRFSKIHAHRPLYLLKSHTRIKPCSIDFAIHYSTMSYCSQNGTLYMSIYLASFYRRVKKDVDGINGTPACSFDDTIFNSTGIQGAL